MTSICGVDCDTCHSKCDCKGCEATCGKPFGGTCIAAEYVKVGGKEYYGQFKALLTGEINALLKSLEIPEITTLYELSGAFVNLEYPIPSGKAVKLLDDTKIYLGAQIETPGIGHCYGVVADSTFILICSYSVDGSEPAIVLYKSR